MSNSSRCAACKSLRRKCPKDCVLAPYFPSADPQRFAEVHKVFGASNITKMLQQLPEHLRAEAADCMAFEANLRVQDPVYGCVGIIFHLQQQIIEVQSEILKTNCEVAYYNARQLQQEQQGQQLQQQQQQIFHSVEPSRHSSSQQDPFLRFQMLTINNPTFGHYG